MIIAIADGALSDASMITMMLVVGAVMFLLEVCTPSFGLLASMGVCAIGGAVYYAFRINSIVGFLVLLGAMIGTPFYLYFMVRLLPNTPLGRRLFLKQAKDATREATPEADELSKLVGNIGVADSSLRPSGTIRIDGHRFVGVAEHEMIDKGEKIKVIKAGGTDVVVRRAEQE